MIDWLQSASHDPVVQLDDRTLPIRIRRHPTARRMILRLAPDGSEVRVTMPRWGRSAAAQDFAQDRRDWIARQLASLAEAGEPCDPFARGTVRYRGEEVALRWSQELPRRPALRDGALSIGGPAQARTGRLQRWLEARALDHFRDDLAHYCARADIAPVPPVRITRARRRWGSCSSKGTVRINWRLVMAPDAVRRSVVAHEVAHLVHFDHSPAFHALLAKLFGPDLAQADRWLKEHGRGLYRDFG